MKPKYTEKQFNSAKSREMLPLQCEECGSIFYKSKHYIQNDYRKNPEKNNRFCSRKCTSKTRFNRSIVECSLCGTEFQRVKSQLRYKVAFCSRSCSCTYQNTHKTKGTRRSKLEVWLETQLTTLYPNLEIHYNRKDTINSELDIYIPSLKLAIELNGIFHYEPIYGKDKLGKIQNNDLRKSQACYERGISFCTIDCSTLKYFKPSNAQVYLDIIKDLL